MAYSPLPKNRSNFGTMRASLTAGTLGLRRSRWRTAPPACGLAVASGVLGAAVPRSVVVVMAEIPGLIRGDGLLASPAGHHARPNGRLVLAAKLPVGRTVAPLGRRSPALVSGPVILAPTTGATTGDVGSECPCRAGLLVANAWPGAGHWDHPLTRNARPVSGPGVLFLGALDGPILAARVSRAVDIRRYPLRGVSDQSGHLPMQMGGPRLSVK